MPETDTDDAPASLTDAHHDWVADTLGVDPRASAPPVAAQPGSAPAPQAAVGDQQSDEQPVPGPTDSSAGQHDEPQGMTVDQGQDLQRTPGAIATNGENATALPVMAALGAAVPGGVPVPLPGPEVEGPISGVRVIEKGAETVGKAVVAVAGGIAMGPLLVGAAVVAAITTWSSSTAPPWMDEGPNPETGKPYTSEEEWKAVKERRARQQRGGGRQPQPGPEVAPDDPDAPPQEPSCKNTFPSIPICASSMNGYDSMDDAEKAQPQYGQSVRSNVTTMDEYRGIPGGENSHATYYDSAGNKLFTLIKTACCQDTAAGPVLNWKWVSS